MPIEITVPITLPAATEIDAPVTVSQVSISAPITIGTQGPAGPAGADGAAGSDGIDGEILATFNVISKNMKSYDYVVTKVAGKVASVTFDTGTGTILKTINRDINGKVSSVVLSGDLPAELAGITTQTITTDIDGNLNISYS